MSKTYNPKRRKRNRTHGFLKRMSTVAGRRILSARRRKKRSRLALR